MKKRAEPASTISERPLHTDPGTDPEATLTDEPLGAGTPPNATLSDGLPRMTPPMPRRSAPRPSPVQGYADPRLARLAKPKAAPEKRPLGLREIRLAAAAGATLGAFSLVMVWLIASGPTSMPPAPVPARAPAPVVVARTAARAFEQKAPEPPQTIYLDVAKPGGGTERKPAGVIKVIARPPADVSVIGGDSFGRTPVQVLAPVGPQKLLLENRELGLKRVVTVDFQPGINASREIESGRGWLEIRAPFDSKVLVDNKPVGVSPLPLQTLYEGSHTVDVVLADRSRDSHQVDVVAGMTVTHEVSPRPAP